MVFDFAMKEIKNFCKDDDTCIFVILVLIGFLLCMFFNRDEGFADYPFGEPGKPQGGGEKHPQGGGEKHIGRIPTQAGKATDEGVKAPTDPNLPQIGKAEELPGIKVRNPGDPINGRGSLGPKVLMARKGEQYPSKVLPNTGGISTEGSSLDPGGPMGVSMNYVSYFPYAKFDKEPSSSLGPAFPTGEPGGADKQVATVPHGPPLADEGVVQGDKKEMKLVLFYAPWCGHSKNMLGDYEAVIQQYDNTAMNGVTLSIIKVDMAENKEGAKPYGVDVKGFPTLYTFVEVNGKLVSQPFAPRDTDAIVKELQKRTKSFGA